MTLAESRSAGAVLAELLEDIRDRIPTSAQSTTSVEIRTSARGADVTVKLYVGSPLGDLGTEAVHEYYRLLDMIELERKQRLNGA